MTDHTDTTGATATGADRNPDNAGGSNGATAEGAEPISPLLEVAGLSAGYGSVAVLHGISFSLGSGELLTVLGHNGAGKTTLASALTGVLKPTHGSIELSGRNVTDRPASALARGGVASVRQDRPIVGELTVIENLRLARLHQRIDEVLAVFPGVFDQRLTQPAGTLSGGEQKMLAVSRCLSTDASMLILDEPTEGLAPANVERLCGHLAAHRDKGRGILLIEQHLAAALSVADRYLVLEKGEIVDHGAVRLDSAERLSGLVTL